MNGASGPRRGPAPSGDRAGRARAPPRAFRASRRAHQAIVLAEPGPDADRVLNTLISSVRFLDPEKPEAAAAHYRQGTELLRSGRKLEGQVELANAFYLLPDRKDFREAFEATLSRPARELPHTLDEVKAKRE